MNTPVKDLEPVGVATRYGAAVAVGIRLLHVIHGQAEARPFADEIVMRNAVIEPVSPMRR